MKFRNIIAVFSVILLLTLSSCGDGVEMLSSSDNFGNSTSLDTVSEDDYKIEYQSGPESVSEEAFLDSELLSSSASLGAASVPSSAAKSSAAAPSVAPPPVSSAAVSSTPPVNKVKTDGEMRAVWISYLELGFSGKTEAQFKSKIDEMMDNIKNAKMNTVVIHARSHGDAYYKSALFPWARTLTGTQGKDPGYDPFAYIIKSAHARGIEVHAWFNPFRVGRTNDTIADLSADNQARKWRTDADPGNDHWVIELPGNGIYYNPGVMEVRNLIVSGVREVVDKYDVDAVHFDDYFYPTTSADFDKIAYDAYKAKTTPPLSLADWRRNNVNQLVMGIYGVAKNKNVEFGISPAANVEHNRDALYADIEKWMNSTDYIDYICPQIYFGFEYPNAKFRYDNMVSVWSKLLKNKNIKLYFGLAQYKIGETDASSDEWIKNDDLIKREVEYSQKDSNYSGFMIFSYKYLFPEGYGINVQTKLIKQRENLISILK